MKLYFYVKNWDDNETFKIIKKYPEIVQFSESYQHYWCDIKFIRKLKLSNIIESNTEYKDIIDTLFDKEKISFLTKEPTFGTSGTTGDSGSSGTSGTSGTSGNPSKSPYKKRKKRKDPKFEYLNGIKKTLNDFDYSIIKELIE